MRGRCSKIKFPALALRPFHERSIFPKPLNKMTFAKSCLIDSSPVNRLLLFNSSWQRQHDQSIPDRQHFQDCWRHLLRHLRTKLNKANKFVLKNFSCSK